MNMFRHDDITRYPKTILAARLLKRLFEEPLRVSRLQQRLPAIATEGNEVQIAGPLMSLQSPRYRERLHPGIEGVCDLQRKSPPKQTRLGWGTLIFTG